MSKSTEHHTAVKDESADRFSSDLDELKSSFSQLREDVTRLLENASGAAESGVGALKAHARDLKRRGVESVDEVEDRIGRKPLLSVALAFGIGFIAANVLMRRR